MGACEARVDLDAVVGFCDGGEPAGEGREGEDVVSGVGHLRWVGDGNGVLWGEEEHGGGSSWLG